MNSWNCGNGKRNRRVEVPVETEGTDDGAEEAHILLELLIMPSQTGDDSSVGVAGTGTILFAAEISLSAQSLRMFSIFYA